MQISVIGVAIVLALFLLGRLVGSTLIVAMMASLAFGSTAIVTLSALGGASPLVYVGFSALVCAGAVFEPATRRHALACFQSRWEPWVVVALAVYACASALIMPRLFAGQTNVFVTSRDIGVVEVALTPGNGNLTQTCYFLLGSMTFLAVIGFVGAEGRFSVLRRAFLTWAAVDAAGGLIDIVGKTIGAGDLLAPVRTASYALLTDVEHEGFSRIAGAYSEASAFAIGSLPALAFALTDWRRTGSRFSGGLAAILLALLVLSTSSTAYAGLTVLGIVLVVQMARSLAVGRVRTKDALILIGGAAAVTVVVGLMVWDPHTLDAATNLFQGTVVDKLQSESGRERSHWNERSLVSFMDTNGIGVGFGSSRASNWLVAVVSQLGLVGSLLQVILLLPLLHAVRAPQDRAPQTQAADLHASLRSCLFACVLGGVISGGTPDPGLLFFCALAGMTACRMVLAPRRPIRLETAVRPRWLMPPRPLHDVG
ncbi:MAG TPA: hypothetical protein VH414_18760 [Lichenihabitans sp.]|nr:hypothetical protein [Lichenihabitans sp.]